MPSVIQEKSYGSVKVFWLNKAALGENLEKAVKKLVSEKPEVEELVLFGSYVENKITVSGDLDILLIVTHSDKPFMDRQEEFRDYFKDIGIGVDLFIPTRKEVNAGVPWVNQILRQGRCLFRRR